jgi:hypothetical protein
MLHKVFKILEIFLGQRNFSAKLQKISKEVFPDVQEERNVFEKYAREFRHADTVDASRVLLHRDKY